MQSINGQTTILKKIGCLLCIFFVTALHLDCAVHSLLNNVKILRINSLKQTVKDKNVITFEGDVEVILDKHLHLWAHYVELNKQKQTILARAAPSGTIIIEDSQFLLFADAIFINVPERTGQADNIRLSVDEGHFSAKKARMLSDADYQLEDMVYTACDAAHPHWKITAHRARVHKTYVVRGSGVVFSLGPVPFFALPYFIMPIQGRSKSGFLVPRFSYDYEYGLGIKQEYYKCLSPHFDTTMGVHWLDKRGIVFTDEIRHASSPESFSQANVRIGNLRHTYVPRNDRIESSTYKSYWIQGQDFHHFASPFPHYDVYTLTRLDFGTDKRLGYHFFNSTDDVDDTFSNSCIARLKGETAQYNVWFETEKAVRNVFQNGDRGTNTEFQSEDRVYTTKLPRLEGNGAFSTFFSYFGYRHDFVVDRMLFRSEVRDWLYKDSKLVKESIITPPHYTDVIRFWYGGDLASRVHCGHHTFSVHAFPTIEAATVKKDDILVSKNVWEERLFSHGGYRMFGKYRAEWALPEYSIVRDDDWYMHTVQPILRWDCLPKFYQEHWFLIDRYDRAYPQQRIKGILKNQWDLGAVNAGLDLEQAYDCYTASDRFMLERGLHDNHAVPFRCDAYVDVENVHVGVGPEIEWKNFQLASCDINTSVRVGKLHIGLGYLFQNKLVEKNRELLSRIPHSVVASIVVPLGGAANIVYDGQFYAMQQKQPFCLNGISPLIHRVRLEYNGHCWGFYLGFEEKKYKEYGIGKNERAIVFALRFDSLGSFAKKFKRPLQVWIPEQ